MRTMQRGGYEAQIKEILLSRRIQVLFLESRLEKPPPLHFHALKMIIG
jgi:hypothetical protein